MKKTIKGITYDTEQSREISAWPDPGLDTVLFQSHAGHFFLVRTYNYVDGIRVSASKYIEAILPGIFDIKSDAIRARRTRKDFLSPVSRAEALRWCLRTHMPRTFHKDLARFLK